MFLFGSNSPSTKPRSFVHTTSLQIFDIRRIPLSLRRSFPPMDSGPAGEYWLAGFVGEDEDWVSKYLQGIHFVNEESDDIEGRSMPMGNTVNADVSSILTSISSSTITHRRATTQQNSERIPFSKRWELLKPEIERLYIHENVPLRGIVGIMKEKYDFDAV
jgi:hypothetical protein